MNEYQVTIINREIEKLTIEKNTLNEILPTMTEKQNNILSETTEIMVRLVEIDNLINSLKENLNA